MYSVGNFYFYSRQKREKDSPWYYGYIPELTFQKDQPVSLQIHPYRMTQDGAAILPLDGDERTAFLGYIQAISEPIADRQKLEWYFKGWCMETGPVYASMLLFDPSYLTNPASCRESKFLNLCNNFTCEAHNELLETLMKIIARGEVDEAKDILCHVRKFMHIPSGGQMNESRIK